MLQNTQNDVFKGMWMTAVVVPLLAMSSMQNVHAEELFQPKLEVTELVAEYPLSSDGDDVSGNSEPMVLKGTTFMDGAIYSDGEYSTSRGDTSFQVDAGMPVFVIRVEFKVPEIITDEHFPVPVFTFLDRWMGVGLENDGTVTLMYDNLAKHVKSNVRYQANVWHELILAYDENDARAEVYFDGALASALDNAPQRDYTTVGLTDYSTGRVFKGWLRNISVGTGIRPVVQTEKSPETQQTDVEYLNNWAAEVRVDLPETREGFQLIDAWSRCPQGCQEQDTPTYLLLLFNALEGQQNTPMAQLAESLKPILLEEYCDSEATQRNIDLGVFFDNRGQQADFNNFWINPADCSASSTQGEEAQTDAEYLNGWAAEVRVGLPETIGDFRLIDAWSRCPDGCQEQDSPTYLLLLFNALEGQQNTPMAQLAASLKPVLLEEYCDSEATRRNINLGVFFDNRGQQADFNNFWVYPEDCSSNAAQGKTVFVTSKEYSGDLGGAGGADGLCQAHAESAGIDGTFMAWISDASGSPAQRFTRSTAPYVLTDGTQIAADWGGLTDGSLDARIDVDENRNKVANNPGTWTGTKENGTIETARSGSPNCSNWTDASSDVHGWHGCTSTNQTNWSTCGTNWCYSRYALYCFQQ